jgi:hypothetical protein
MQYKVIYSKQVIKFLNKHHELHDIFYKKINLLSIGETATLNIKPLQ